MCGNNLGFYFIKYAQNVYISIFQNSSDIKYPSRIFKLDKNWTLNTVWDGESMFEFHHCISRNNV